MLLGHTSGIFGSSSTPTTPSGSTRTPTMQTPEEILTLTGKRTNAPGKAFSCSSTNYVLLGLILERVTGVALADLVHDRLLVPLGLDQTMFQQAGRPNGLVGAKGFWKERGRLSGVVRRHRLQHTSTATVAWATGAIEGSVREPARLGDGALRGVTMATSDALAQMLDFDRKSGYGLGARTQTVAKRAGYGTAARCVGSCR
ncbi:MAG: serine hydrolase [Chloroflexota bacterium]